MKCENLEKVDASYDDNNKKEQKSMNSNEDIIIDKWSRYIRSMGIEAFRRQANIRILVYDVGGLRIEITKNLVYVVGKKLVFNIIK